MVGWLCEYVSICVCYCMGVCVYVRQWVCGCGCMSYSVCVYVSACYSGCNVVCEVFGMLGFG